MRQRSQNGPSSALAIFAAGPLFLVGLGLEVVATAPGYAIPAMDLSEGLAMAWGALAIFGLSSIVGAALSAVPNLVASTAMHWLGRDNMGMRLPVMWGLVGGLAAGAPAFVIAGEDGRTVPVAFAFAFTGAACALIIRYRTSWDTD